MATCKNNAIANNNVSTTYVHNYQDLISYYDKKDSTKSFLPQPSSSIGVQHNSEAQTVNTVQPSERSNSLLNIDNNSDNNNNNNNNNNTPDMTGLELVSPVQGAVQQARAQYEMGPPIKRRKYRKRAPKKSVARRRKQSRKKKKRRKPVKRLKKKKVQKRKRQYRKRKKRDIFNE
jgi:hypothetical protein